jgi:hypothetical protein
MCLDRGALVLSDWGLAHLVFLYAVPVYPRSAAAGGKGRLGDSAGGMGHMIIAVTGHMGESEAGRLMGGGLRVGGWLLS